MRAGQIRHTRYWDLEYRGKAKITTWFHWGAPKVREGMRLCSPPSSDRSSLRKKDRRLLERRHGQQQRRGLHETSATLPSTLTPFFLAEAVYSEIGVCPATTGRTFFARTTTKLSLTSPRYLRRHPQDHGVLRRAFRQPLPAIGAYHCAPHGRAEIRRGPRSSAGDGGDELFAGKRALRDRPSAFSLYQHIPAFLRKGLIEAARFVCFPPK